MFGPLRSRKSESGDQGQRQIERSFRAIRETDLLTNGKQKNGGCRGSKPTSGVICQAARPPRKSTWCWCGSLDRWGRPVADLVATLQEPSHLEVRFVSLTEALI